MAPSPRSRPKRWPGDDRVPVTAEHRRDVVDPLTAWLIPAGRRHGLARAACERTLPIFDGQRRYDLKLAFKRMDKVKADEGYHGPALVCAVTFQPVAGHRASEHAGQILAGGREIELWLAPVAGTRSGADPRVSRQCSEIWSSRRANSRPSRSRPSRANRADAAGGLIHSDKIFANYATLCRLALAIVYRARTEHKNLIAIRPEMKIKVLRQQIRVQEQ